MKEVPPGPPLLPFSPPASKRGEKGGEEEEMDFYVALLVILWSLKRGIKKERRKRIFLATFFWREHFLGKLLGFRTIQVVFSAKLRIGNVLETEGSCCEGNANIFRGIECCYAGTKGVLGRKGWGMFFIVPRHFLWQDKHILEFCSLEGKTGVVGWAKKMV